MGHHKICIQYFKGDHSIFILGLKKKLFVYCKGSIIFFVKNLCFMHVLRWSGGQKKLKGRDFFE